MKIHVYIYAYMFDMYGCYVYLYRFFFFLFPLTILLTGTTFYPTTQTEYLGPMQIQVMSLTPTPMEYPGLTPIPTEHSGTTPTSLNNKCLMNNIVYEARVETGNRTYSYIGCTGTSFKKRWSNHVHSFKNPGLKNTTSLAKIVHDLRDRGIKIGI